MQGSFQEVFSGSLRIYGGLCGRLSKQAVSRSYGALRGYQLYFSNLLSIYAAGVGVRLKVFFSVPCVMGNWGFPEIRGAALVVCYTEY